MATVEEIRTSYDLGNDFFALWLDENLNYSCADWRGAPSLEAAQEQKLQDIHDLAGIGPGMNVLDIGCGWGANLEAMTRTRGIGGGTGLTMSDAQADYATSRGIPGVSVEIIDFKAFHPSTLFDAVTSLEMFEHIARPDEAFRGTHMSVFRNYFRTVHSWTNPGALFGLQTITLSRMPRDRRHIIDMARATARILPGSRCSRLEECIQAASEWWEVKEMRTLRTDYVLTAGEWLRRLRECGETIKERWGEALYDDYDHYLRSCVWAFELSYLSVHQLSLGRIDEKGGPRA